MASEVKTALCRIAHSDAGGDGALRAVRTAPNKGD